MRKIKRQMPIMAFLDGHIRIFPNMSLTPIKILKMRITYMVFKETKIKNIKITDAKPSANELA